MRHLSANILLGMLVALAGISAADIDASALSTALPSGGAGVILNQGTTLGEVTASSSKHNHSITAQISSVDQIVTETEPEQEVAEEETFKNLVIAQVNSYVNVRDLPSEIDGKIIGKLYDDSVGDFIEEENGWYLIKSGSVTGYVKGEYCVTGEDAVELAKQVGTRFATVTTTTLKVRSEADIKSACIGLVPEGEEFVVLAEEEGWVNVDTVDGKGWISSDYVKLHTEFVKAESREEEKARLAKEAEERRKARAAAAAATAGNSSANKSEPAKTYTVSGDGSELGKQVAEFALQYVGNPYVYGGTSLTNGADCSGFVLSVYANFGVSLPHSAGADRKQGSAVEGGIDGAAPGDLVCYSGHVGIYIGDGQIVHAANRKKGIRVDDAKYAKILAVRRIF